VRIPDFAALRHYAMRVAGTVGVAMCHVFDVRHPAVLNTAAELGIAMQLTNVLRDVGGDLRRGRIYLPADEMRCFGYSEDRLIALALRGEGPDEDFKALLRFQITRARGYYARGLVGVWALPPAVRPAILIAGRLYGAILDQIEANGYDVLRRRAATSRLVKAREAMAALLIARLWGNRTAAEFPAPGAVYVGRGARG
jgi:phytoene synthase